MKLWEKGIPTDKQIEHFTVGNDRELDLVLAKYDALGSIAHAKMLGQIGLLTAEETTSLVDALTDIIADIAVGNFEIEDSFEDVHSKIEYLLTEKPGILLIVIQNDYKLRNNKFLNLVYSAVCNTGWSFY
jgi:argininosuccinate lyase